MAQSKTGPSAIDRRRFPKYTGASVGASLGLALVPGEAAFAAPRLTPAATANRCAAKKP
jgi:hypothetical protein